MRASARPRLRPTSKRRILPCARMLSDQLRVPAGVMRTLRPGTAPSTSSNTFMGSGFNLVSVAALSGGTRFAIKSSQRFHLGFTVREIA